MKKRMIYVSALSLLILIFSLTALFFKNISDKNNSDKVVLRFAVTSKSFVFDESCVRLTNFIDSVYSYAEKMPYDKVDAFIINGNLTGDGTKNAFDAVEMLVNEHLKNGSKFYATMGELDFLVGETDEVDDPDIKNKIEDKHVNINGYDFIFLSPVYISYESKLKWLENEINKATLYNNRPVFVFQYLSLKDTFWGSESWYTSESDAIMNVLEKYDTVVDFASSSATPANTVRSVFQKNATYVNTGVITQGRMNYYEFGYDTSKEIIGENINNVSQCKIVEVYGSGKVVMYTMDLNTGNLYMNPEETDIMEHIVYPGEKDTYAYTSKDKEEIWSNAPSFFRDSYIDILDLDNTHVNISFPQATDKDGVLFYRIVLRNSNGEIVKEECTYSDIAQYSRNKQKTYNLSDLELSGRYYIEIYPYDMYGVVGNKIMKEFVVNSK